MRVYCENCRHVRSWSDCNGGVYIKCRAGKVTAEKDTPTQLLYKRETCEEKNKDNKCTTFSKAKWWQKLWANTCG